MTRLVVCAALGVEARALRDPAYTVVRTGMGVRRASAAARLLPAFDALAVAGFGGALDDRCRPGDLVVATEVRTATGVLPCPHADDLADRLARGGATVRRGPVVTVGHTVTGRERRALADLGAVAVDMESAPLAASAGDRPWAVVRAVVDGPGHPLVSPGTVVRGLAARRRLRRSAAALAAWAAASAPCRTTDSHLPEEAGP
ncbi:hypothetical protein BTM25_46280 [Actinomadura rubteroloni]|uniref:Nucleoside phosphorylase domain-containing protein n=1 Tax=Actinomadura rubteroloni TaxID=1926885 RepID=A0A2P4UEI1_9ACTN|nr:hypothetical protein [Actinomadura rubteroloni]POM23474.1 hypothetical protein BTM25_46280 [Actinomadura rubteroloni]